MEILNGKKEESWKNFTDRFKNVPPQYSLKWKESLEKSYKNCVAKYYFFEGKNGAKIIFPFFIVKSKIFGDRIISQPFLDFGGPLGEFDRDLVKNVVEDIIKIANIKKIEIRANNFSSNYKKLEHVLEELGFKKQFKKNQMILKLESEESLWNNFDRITRKGIKKAQKSGLNLNDISNELELKNFYNLYLNSMKNFGTPQHSYEFFYNFMTGFKGGFKGFNCYKKGEIVGSLIVFYSKDYMYAAYNVSNPKFLIYQPNDLLHWEMIKWAIKKGINHFDFGQCDKNAKQGTHASGIYRFKSKWKADLYEKFYFYYDLNESSEKNEISKGKSKYEKAIKIWKNLPLPLIKKIGPKIASQLAL